MTTRQIWRALQVGGSRVMQHEETNCTTFYSIYKLYFFIVFIVT